MSLRDRNILFRSTLTATLWIAIGMLAVLLTGLWAARRDLSEIRETLFRSEVVRVYSAAVRAVSRIEQQLNRAETPNGAETEPSDMWPSIPPLQAGPGLYTAIVDSSGRIVRHTRQQSIGGRLPADWRNPVYSELDQPASVSFADSDVLTGGRAAIDVSVQILNGEEPIGTYHQGIDRQGFEGQVSRRLEPVRMRWTVIIALMFLVVLLAGVSVFRISRQASALQHAISISHVKQLSDLGRVVGALAHEIRNPLNAIRLNLHALRNVLRGKASLSEDEIEQAIDESNREIQRLSELMKTMLGYARPDQAVVDDVDLNAEIEGMASFLMPIMDRDGVTLTVSLPADPAIVAIDGDRLRQILLNLLTNAREAAGHGGRVDILLTRSPSHVDIAVVDTGPGVPESDREVVFDAFYSTRETGTGLGLALVKRFVEEAGGTVVCEEPDDRDSGAAFRITLPCTGSPADPENIRPAREAFA